MERTQVDELLETIADRSHELCSMIQTIQELEGRNPSEAWLFVFREITRAWFNNDNDRLDEISNFIIFGRHPSASGDVRNMIFGPGPLTNH